jgi:CBS domain-containing protein
MSETPISQDSFYFIEVALLCKRPPVTCSPQTSLIEMAGVMREHNISGIVVVEGTMPIGVVSVRDLRDLVATDYLGLASLTVQDVMQTDLITIRRQDYLFKAIFKMARHNIHRLVVVHDDGSLAGVVTNSDLLRIQSHCPLYLSQVIEAAESYEQLRAASTRLIDLLQFVVKAGAETQSLISLISHFNDLMSLRVITLLDRLEGVQLPRSAAFLVMGSEGREEQTLRTDQDNAIVYSDAVSDGELQQIKRFAERMVDRLEFIGVPRCPGGIMASNRPWCHSISTWKRILSRWIGTPSLKNMVKFGMFQDMRVIHGNLSLEKKLREHITSTTHQHSLFFTYMAHNIVQFSPPLGLFGRIKLESKGEHKGTIDLKKAGIFALTQGVSLLALLRRNMGGTTWDKIGWLRHDSQISKDDLGCIEESFSFLIRLRLMLQLEQLAHGKTPENYCDPALLSAREQEQLRDALKGVQLLIQILKDEFQLDMIRM